MIPPHVFSDIYRRLKMAEQKKQLSKVYPTTHEIGVRNKYV